MTITSETKVGDKVVHEGEKGKVKAIQGEGARKVAENWKDFGLQKTPPPVDGVIDLSYLAEARK